MYWSIEQKCRKYTKIIACYIILNQSMYTAAIVVSVCSMVNGDFDTSNWLLPWSVPFDTINLSVLQWYLLWFTQFSFGLAYSSSTLTVTSYFVCGCFYIDGFYQHFKFLIHSISNDLKFYHKAANENDREKKAQCIKDKLFKAIDIHTKIYE